MAGMFESLGLDITNAPLDIALNLLNIALLYLIVRFLVYKPVKKFLEQRTSRIAAANADASGKASEAEKVKAEYQAYINDAEAEKNKLLSDELKKAKEESDKIITGAKKEAEKLLAASRESAEKERSESLSSMKDEVISLAVSISEKMLEREMTDADNRHIADEFFKAEAVGKK